MNNTVVIRNFKGKVLGSIETKPNGDKIVRAITKAGYNFEALSDEPLSDLGRIVFVE